MPDDNFRSKLDRVEDKVGEILSVLKGDDFGQSRGLVEEVKSIKNRVKSLEDLKKKMLYLASGAGIGAGFAIDKLVTFIKSLLIICIAILFFSSCATLERKKANAHIYFGKNKAELYELCEFNFPSKTGDINVKKGDVKISLDSLYVPKSITIKTVDCPDGTILDCPPCDPDTLTITRYENRVDTIEITSFKYKDLYDSSIQEKEFDKRKIRFQYFVIGFLAVLLAVAVFRRK